MEPFRLKLKVGPHEFEAEGEQESVERQFALWRELIASPSATPPTAASPPPSPPPGPPPPIQAMAPNIRMAYEKVFHHAGRIVSLTVLPTGPNKAADAALLILLGQKAFNGDDLVTGAQVMDGLKQSGVAVERADRVFGPHMDTSVIRIGQHRAVKYRLTNVGLLHAKNLGDELLEQVA
jgi:hypothetical protein